MRVRSGGYGADARRPMTGLGNHGRRTMSVSAIGGMSPQVTFAPVHAAAKPEASETPGQPDHDGDSDDRAATAVTGRSVNVLA